MKTRLLAGALVLSCGAYSSAFLVVDNFTSGPYSATYSTINNTQTVNQTGTMLGGVRWLTYTITYKQLPQAKYHVDLGDGAGMVSSDSGLRNTTILDYGLNSQLGYNDLNLNLSGNTKIDLNFYNNDQDLTLLLFLRSASQNSGDYVMHSYTIGASENPFTYSINLQDFTGLNMADVDQLAFSFSNKMSGDYALDNIRVVPEPATIGLMLAGLGALGLKRRKS